MLEKTRWLSRTLVTLCALIAASVPAAAQRPAGASPIIGAWVRVVGETGTSGTAAGGTLPFVVGQPVTQYVFAGSRSSSPPSLCAVGTADEGVRSLEQLVAAYAHVWKVTIVPEKYEAGTESFTVEWQRYAGESGVRPVVSGRRQVSLVEGASYDVDLVHAEAGAGSCPAHALVVRLEAAAKEDPSLAETMLQYDLWLTHRDVNGRKTTRHVVLTGRHGRELPFDFSPLRFAVPKLAPDQYEFQVVTRVSGHVRARLQPDGRIDVDLGTTRTDRLERPSAGSPGDGLIFGQGRKRLDVASGEVLEIHLPSGSGYSSTYASPAAAAAAKTHTSGGRGGRTDAPPPTQPFAITDGRFSVYYKPFFEGQQTSIVVQVTKRS